MQLLKEQRHREEQRVTRLKARTSLSNSLLSWYTQHEQKYPWRLLWAQTKDPYFVWISEIMLQQTTLKAVLPKYDHFINLFPDVRTLADAEPIQLKLAVQGLGYYRRFDLLHKAAKKLIEQSPSHSILWPTSYKEWTDLPGIGPYTASAMASITLNEPVAAVDGNVERVFSRLFRVRRSLGFEMKFKEEIRVLTQKQIDPERPGIYNQAVMEWGQFICTPQKPKCTICPQKESCEAFQAKEIDFYPTPLVKPLKQDVFLKLTIPFKKNKLGLLNRGPSALFLKNTLGFPFSIEKKASKKRDFVHHITKYKIHVKVEADEIKNAQLQWIPLEDVDGLLVSNLDRKALRVFSHSKVEAYSSL